MNDILTVGDLIAELSKHPADAQVRVINYDSEYGNEEHFIEEIYLSKNEAALCIDTSPDSPEERKKTAELHEAAKQAWAEKHGFKSHEAMVEYQKPGKSYVRCNPDDEGAEQRSVSGNLLWVRPV